MFDSGTLSNLRSMRVFLDHRLTFNYGPYDDTKNQNTKIDLLFTVTVNSEPFADGLFLTNLAHSHEATTNTGPLDQNAIVEVQLTEPVLSITKSAVSTDNPNVPSGGLFTPPTASPAPPAANPRFTGTISSSNLPPDLDLAGVDAHDRVTFSVIVENTGSSRLGAFDVRLRDTIPDGFKIPASGLNLSVTYGDGADFDADNDGIFEPDDFVGKGTDKFDSGPDGIPGTLDDFFGAGIELVDPAVNNNANPPTVIMPPTVTTTGTVTGVVDHSTTNNVNFWIDEIAGGASVTFTYTVEFTVCDDIHNFAEVIWTSLPGPQGTFPNPKGSQTPGVPGAANGERNDFDFPNQPNDYLAFAEQWLGSIGDFVWHDVNGDGVQDNGEQGLPWVKVDLAWQEPRGPVTRSTMTDANGFYHFCGLPGGNYKVSVDLNSLDPRKVPTVDLFQDSGSTFVATEPVVFSGIVDGIPVDLELGRLSVGAQHTVLAAAPNPSANRPVVDPTLAIGIVFDASIHGKKFEDKNANGVLDEVHLIHGVEDNYQAGNTETASPSPGLLQHLSGLPLKQYDDTTVDRVFADSFMNLPNWITGAQLRIGLRPSPLRSPCPAAKPNSLRCTLIVSTSIWEVGLAAACRGWRAAAIPEAMPGSPIPPEAT